MDARAVRSPALREPFTMIKPSITLGYDLDAWTKFGIKDPIKLDLSASTNSQLLLAGLSGGGKTYAEQYLLQQLHMAQPQGEIYFGDYKQDDSLSYLRPCPFYYPYRTALTALDIVHKRLLARQSGEDTSRNLVSLLIDEYIAMALNLISEDKKAAAAMMNKVSEILFLGRSLSVRISISCQRPDALAIPAGGRLNLGVILILGGGSANRSVYEMLIPDFMEEIKGRQFGRGEGVVVLEGSQIRFIKIPTVRDENRMRRICIKALSRG